MAGLGRAEPRIIGPLPGPRSAAWLERDDRVMSPSYTRAYPLVVRRARGAMIEDMDGNRFLDFTAGIAVTNVGHSHPQGRGGDPQAGGPADPHVGDRLLLHAAGPAGGAAGGAGAGPRAEAGLLHQQRCRGDRGRAQAGAAAHGPQPRAGVHERLSRPDLRRDVALRLEADAAPRLLAAGPRYPSRRATATSRASAPLLRTICPPEELAAIFVEPIQGEGGYIVPPADFLPGLRRLCDEHRVLLVFDEIQSGIGRTGKMFASEHWGVAGDIVCLAKGIANGLPLGAIVARASVMDWPSGSHASTFGGNPVACAASLATLRLVETAISRQCRPARPAAARGPDGPGPPVPLHPRGARARADDRRRDPGSQTGEPNPRLRDWIIDLAFHRGLLLLPCGPSTIRFCPPLCLTSAPGRDRAQPDRRRHDGGRRGDRIACRTS